MWQFNDSEELEFTFLPGSSIQRARANSDWIPLDHVPLTEPITVAHPWSALIGWPGHMHILRAGDGVGPT